MRESWESEQEGKFYSLASLAGELPAGPKGIGNCGKAKPCVGMGRGQR